MYESIASFVVTVFGLPETEKRKIEFTNISPEMTLGACVQAVKDEEPVLNEVEYSVIGVGKILNKTALKSPLENIHGLIQPVSENRRDIGRGSVNIHIK